MEINKFNVGQSVNATALGHIDYRTSDVLKGIVVGEYGVLVLINFGARFDGHAGHGLVEGVDASAPTHWYVHRDFVTALPDAIAPAAKAPQAKQQGDRILNHLVSGKSITQLEAFGVYRIFRLAARIHELKSKGHKIVTTMHKDETGKPYAEYSLVTARRA
jgi:hypothetical protein